MSFNEDFDTIIFFYRMLESQFPGNVVLTGSCAVNFYLNILSEKGFIENNDIDFIGINSSLQNIDAEKQRLIADYGINIIGERTGENRL